MDKPKYTPGPWKVQQLEQTRQINSQERGMNDPYRILSIKESGCEEVAKIDGKADALLMAESPEMFRIILRFATVDWMGEKELSAIVKECKAIVERVNRHG